MGNPNIPPRAIQDNEVLAIVDDLFTRYPYLVQLVLTQGDTLNIARNYAATRVSDMCGIHVYASNAYDQIAKTMRDLAPNFGKKRAH